MSEIYKGEACIDCVIMIANNDNSGMTEEEFAEWTANVERFDACESGKYYAVVDCDEDCEGWFSWSSCDYCNSRLGGDRHPIVFIERG